MTGIEGHLLNFVQSLYNRFGYGGVIIAMAIESCCIPLPSEIIMPLAGFMVGQHMGGFSLVGVTIAGAVGGTLGSAVAYWIGAAGGRPAMLKYGRFVLISHHDADLADGFFARYGDATIFFTRLMPIVRTFISLPAGITHMNFTKFALFTFIGSLIWCIILAYVGQQLGSHWTEVGGTIRKYDYVVLLAILVLLGLYIYRHVRQTRAE